MTTNTAPSKKPKPRPSKKKPFIYQDFFPEIILLLRRDPIYKDYLSLGGEDWYDYHWQIKPEDREFKELVREVCPKVAEMMRQYDLRWPDSRCDVAIWPNSIERGLTFRITVVHKIKKQNEGV